MKNILVLGASGLVGYKISNILASTCNVFGTYNQRIPQIDHCKLFKWESKNFSFLENFFDEVSPDVVINSTALHNVDYCEENHEESYQVNSKLIQQIKQLCDKNNSKFIHISTDYVFDGKQRTPYTENDQPNPKSVYAMSKLDGENKLKNSNHIIIRPSVVYGWSPLEISGTTSSSGKPMNFAIWLLSKLSKNEKLSIVTDQFATATLADTIADGVSKMIETKKSGIYHLSGLSCESRYEFSIKLAKVFGYDVGLISPTSSSNFKQKAERPVYSCLNCEKIMKDFNLKLLSSDDSLKIMKNQVEKEAPHLIKK